MLEEVKNESVETSDTQSTEVETAQETAQETTQETKEAAEITEVAAAQAQYTPNYKFNVHDNEFEFDEVVKPLVTSKEVEDHLRTLYAKGYGIDEVQKARDSWSEKYKTIEGQYNSITSSLAEASEYLNKGQLDKLFKSIGVPEDQVYKFVMDKLNYRDLSPEQKKVYDSYQELETQADLLRKQNELLQQQYESTTVQTRSRELESVLARPDIKPIMDAYDSEVKSPGAFRQEVINRAIAEWQLNGEDITADKAVSRVMTLIGNRFQSNQTGLDQGVVAKPIIPNVHSRAVSPARKIPKSIDDLKKLANEM